MDRLLILSEDLETIELNKRVTSYWWWKGFFYLFFSIIGIPFIPFWFCFGCVLCRAYFKSVRIILMEGAVYFESSPFWCPCKRKQQHTILYDDIVDVTISSTCFQRCFGVECLTMKSVDMAGLDPSTCFKFDGILACEDFRTRVLRHNLDSAVRRMSTTSSCLANLEGPIIVRSVDSLSSISKSISVPLAHEPEFVFPSRSRTVCHGSAEPEDELRPMPDAGRPRTEPRWRKRMYQRRKQKARAYNASYAQDSWVKRSDILTKSDVHNKPQPKHTVSGQQSTSQEKWKPYKAKKPRNKTHKRDMSAYESRMLRNGMQRKLGPRDVGRAKHWKPAKYNLNLDYDFLQPRGIRKEKFVGRAEHQLGPREIGIAKGFVPAQYDVDPWRENRTEEGTFTRVERKLGPQDIGRLNDYEVAEYDLHSSGEIMAERVHKCSFNRKVERALGPKDIGYNKDYEVKPMLLFSPENISDTNKVARYSISDSEGSQVWKERFASSNPRNQDYVEHKQGPVEIGFARGFIPARYDAPQDFSGDHSYYLHQNMV